MSTKVKRGSNADYPVPTHITDEDYDGLAAVQRFTPEEKEPVRIWLRWIIDDVSARMRAPKGPPGKSPGELVETIEQMITLHRKALIKSRELDRETGGALTYARSQRMINVLTLDVLQASPKYASVVAERREAHAASGFEFVPDDFEQKLPMSVALSLSRDLYGELLQGEIDDLEGLLQRARGAPRSQGGNPAHRWRIHLIGELAELYYRLGRNPTTTPTAKHKNPDRKQGLFVDFVEGVFSAIGWPTDGIDRAVYNHLPPFRDYYQWKFEEGMADAAADMAAAERDQQQEDGDFEDGDYF